MVMEFQIHSVKACVEKYTGMLLLIPTLYAHAYVEKICHST